MRKQRGRGIFEEFGSVPELYQPFITIASIGILILVALTIVLFTMSSLSESQRTQIKNTMIIMTVITFVSFFVAILTGRTYL